MTQLSSSVIYGTAAVLKTKKKMNRSISLTSFDEDIKLLLTKEIRVSLAE